MSCGSAYIKGGCVTVFLVSSVSEDKNLCFAFKKGGVAAQLSYRAHGHWPSSVILAEVWVTLIFLQATLY